MADNTLTIRLEGDVLLSQFTDTLLHFRNLVDLLSREIVPDTDIEWFVDELHAGSALATIAGIAEDEEPVLKVVKGYSKVGDALQQRVPIPFSEGIAREAKAITNVIGDKIISVQFMTADIDAIIYGPFDPKQRTSGTRKISFGIVKGQVQTLSRRGKLKFTLYDSTFDKAIPCYLQDGEEDKMREIWGKNVIVTGRIFREPDNGRPISVRDITSIDPIIEPEPGSFKIARGIFPWSEGDETAEVSIRRLRDAED